MAKDPNGVLYFATSNGLVEFDGSEWQRIDNWADPDFRFVIYQDKKLYVTAQNDFGYFELDSAGVLSYHSITNTLPKSWTEIGESWQAIPIRDRIYFQTDRSIYCYKKDSLKIVPLQHTYIFNVEDQLFASDYYTHEFGPVKKGKIIPVINSSSIKGSVYYVEKFSGSKYLVVTTQGGLFFYDSQTNEINSWDCEAADVLKKTLFFDGYKVNDNLYALGTYEGGLLLIDREGRVVKSITVKDGLPSVLVQHIIPGNQNDLWVGTSNGIARVGIDSLAVIPAEGRTIIKKVILDDESIVFDAFNPELPFFPRRNEKYTSQNISFIFADPGLAGEQVEFSYYLEGFDDNWSNWSSQNKRDFTRLPSGNYIFKVKSRVKGGEQHGEASFNFGIGFPWYQTTTFIVFVILIILSGLVYILVKIRTNALNKSKAKLEKLVQSKTSELLEKQENLENLNDELMTINKALDSFVYHTSHDLKAPLKSILGLINITKEQVQNPEETKSYLDLMQKSVSRLDEFITSVIEYSVNAKSQMKHEKIDFEKIIDEVLYDLREFEDFKEINFKKEIHIEKPFLSDPDRLKIIFNNLVSNSIKYSDLQKEEPFVNITVNSVNGDLNINFADNGIGINEEYRIKIFDMFFRASEKSKGSGLGLYIVKETVDNLKGRIQCNSKPLEGTNFDIWLPYN